jgi:general secretion pathway protein C
MALASRHLGVASFVLAAFAAGVLASRPVQAPDSRLPLVAAPGEREAGSGRDRRRALPHVPPAPAPLPAALDPGALDRLLGIARDPQDAHPVPVRAPVARCEDADAPPARSALPLAVIAATLTEDPRRSLATVVDLATRESRLLDVGAQFAGATLLGLSHLRDAAGGTGNAFRLVAVVCHAGSKEYVEVGPAPPAPAPAAPAPASSPRATALLPAGPAPFPPGAIRPLGPGRYAVHRAALDAARANPLAFANDARALPVLRDGAMAGLRLTALRPGSALAALGLENGDVIRTIDGFELTPELALELSRRLRDTTRVTLELERAGRPVRLEYAIGGP